jgi:hypothetical protein
MKTGQGDQRVDQRRPVNLLGWRANCCPRLCGSALLAVDVLDEPAFDPLRSRLGLCAGAMPRLASNPGDSCAGRRHHRGQTDVLG